MSPGAPGADGDYHALVFIACEEDTRAVHVRDEPQRLADHFALLGLKVLEQIVLGANDDDGDGDRVERILVRVLLAKRLPCPDRNERLLACTAISQAP